MLFFKTVFNQRVWRAAQTRKSGGSEDVTALVSDRQAGVVGGHYVR